MTESFNFDDIMDEVSNLYAIHKLSPPLVRLITGYAHKIEAVLMAGNQEGGFANGVGDKAKFNTIRGLCELPTGNLLVSDHNNQIRHLDIKTQAVTTYAGSHEGFADGAADKARFRWPLGLTCDPEGTV